MASGFGTPKSDKEVESPRKSFNVEPGFLWKGGEEMMPQLLEEQHAEVMHTLQNHGEMLYQVLARLAKGGLPSPHQPRRAPLRTCTEDSDDGLVLHSDSDLVGQQHSDSGILPMPRTLRFENKNKPIIAKAQTSKRNMAVPRKPKRDSFTPQLFKTFSQTDVKLRNNAKAADKIHTTEMAGTTQRRWAQKIVNHPAFDCFFTLVVISNSLFIGVELQVSVDTQGGETPLFIQLMLYLYTALFVLELWFRLAADRCKFLFGEDWAWAWLDIFIVVTSLWEVVIEVLSSFKGEGNESIFGAFTSLKAVRVVRITRIVKVSRLVRIFRFILALRTLIASIVHTLKSLVWALLLLALIAYVFAVLFMQAVNDYIQDGGYLPDRELLEAQVHFGTIGDTMLGLFMSITGGVNWQDVLGPLKFINTIWVFLFLFYIAFTYFAVLNVLTAVFCQSAIDGAQNDHASKVHAVLANKEAHLEKIHDVFSKFGADDGVITFSMFQKKINSPEVREYFQTLGLDVWDAWTFFKLLDKDNGGAVEVEEFLMGCLRLRGQASAMDVGRIINDQTWLIKTQGKFHAYMEVELKQIKEQLSALTGCNSMTDEHIGFIFASHNLGDSDDSDAGSCADGHTPKL